MATRCTPVPQEMPDRFALRYAQFGGIDIATVGERAEGRVAARCPFREERSSANNVHHQQRGGAAKIHDIDGINAEELRDLISQRDKIQRLPSFHGKIEVAVGARRPAGHRAEQDYQIDGRIGEERGEALSNFSDGEWSGHGFACQRHGVVPTLATACYGVKPVRD